MRILRTGRLAVKRDPGQNPRMPTTLRIPGLVLTEHEIDVPLDHAKPDGERISVFVREVADPDGLDRPFLLFLQGGPGGEAPRPMRHPTAPGWLDAVLPEFRVLMLDQRGTGRSAPVGTLPGMSPQQQAEHLALFRADSIVRDCEVVREALGVERWSLLGQSFGGFCSVTYLSLFPDSLREALITGGLPPLVRPIDDVYERTYARMRERTGHFLARYPADLERLRTLLRELDEGDVRLPSGDRLTSRRLRQLGNMLGMSDGPDKLHYLLERPVDSPGFLHGVEGAVNFGHSPIYSVLQEGCYADGTRTNWAAQRLLPDDFVTGDLLTAEHVFPWMFEEYGWLRPLRACAEILAGWDWPKLYDPDVLRQNEVPVAAAVYLDDPYVVQDLSLETAAAIKGCRPWATNEYLHNGLRVAGGRILGRLLDLTRGRA
jgi:pimeloyl-ACP methyl ester carboxylesterase